MNAQQIITQLESAGIRLWEEAGVLRYRGPKAVLTPERLATVRANRDAVLDVLRKMSNTVVPEPTARHDPFPLTDVQAAYLFGRHTAFGFGGVACHMYVELELENVAPARLEWAWNRLVARHDMLRAVVDIDGSQRVLSDVPAYRIAISDGSNLAATRAEMGHCMRDPAVWPLFELRLTKTPAQSILHLSIDFIIADWTSIRILQNELELLRQAAPPDLPPLDLTFRDYVYAQRRTRESSRFERDRAYWHDRIDQMASAPELPVAHDAASDAGLACFRRLTLRLSGAQWSSLRARAAAWNVTASSAILAAYAEVVGAWSRHAKFTLNLTLLNRLPLHPSVARTVGDFTSLTLLAVDNEHTASFGARAANLSAQLFEDLDHRLYSGVEVMREIARRRGRDAALMPVVYTSAIGVDSSSQSAASASQPKLGWGITQTPQVWIDCQAMNWQGELLVNWDIREGVLVSGVVDDMFAAFSQLLTRLDADSNVWDLHSPVELPADQAERRRCANATEAPLPSALLHESVLAVALRTPERTAVVSSRLSLTYEGLFARAAAVANQLKAAGCGPHDLVAVYMDKGWEQVVAVLGILIAGGAWLPIDTNQPKARRELLMHNTGVRHIVTQSWLLDDSSEEPNRRTMIAVDTLAAQAGALTFPERLVSADDMAYVIFTSGSTGEPKGVIVSHASALNTIVDINRRFDVGSEDRVLALANLGFDLSVYDLFGPLSEGGCVVLADVERRTDPSHWAALLVEHAVTVWNSVPAQMQMLGHFLDSEKELAFPRLRLALLSGDWIPLGLPAQIRAHIPHLEIVSLGGATEAAIWSIFHRIEAVLPEWRSIPYGKPLANQSFHVLGPEWRDCPDWVTGELYIGGAGLAQGYLRDQAKTAQHFVTHPQTGQRLYRTGDLGRYLSDGNIEFLGREDSQVKLLGHRIDLAEVEAALHSHPAVADVAVIMQRDNLLQRRLVAFATPRAGAGGEAPIDVIALTAELLTHLAKLLPSYMIPARIEVLQSLPLSDNGKLDRRALLAMARTESEAGEPPCTDLERRLAQIWAEVLGIPCVARDGDFFRLGGDSLGAAKLVGRIRESIPEAAGLFFDSLIRQLLPAPTIAALAAHLEAEKTAHPARPAAPVNSPLLHLGGEASVAARAVTYTLVHDGAGRLVPYRTLVSYLCSGLPPNGPPPHIVGFAVNEAESYLHPSAAALIERRAASYARLLQTQGHHRAHVLGGGFGALLAINLASQLMERGVEVAGVTLFNARLTPSDLDPETLERLFMEELGAGSKWPDVDSIDDAAVLRQIFDQSARASAATMARSPSPYVGDVTLLRAAAQAGHDVDWRALCLGQLRTIDVEPVTGVAEIASHLFEPELAARTAS